MLCRHANNVVLTLISCLGFVPFGNMPALCQSEAVLFKQMAYFPQQLPIQSQG